MTRRPPGRVAVVRLSALGDVVHALPVAAALRQAWPEARLTWIVEERYAAILAGHPSLDEVFTIDTRAWRRARGLTGVASVASSVVAVCRRLRTAGYDVAFDVQGLVKSGLVTWATRAPVRIGFAGGWRRERLAGLFTNHRVTPPRAAIHVVDQYLALLGGLGIAPPVRPEFHLPCSATAEAEVDAAFVAAGLVPGRRLVVLNPGAGRPAKQWAPERFVELARELGREGAQVLVLWGPGEEAAARDIARAAGVLAPPTDLHRLLAVLRRATTVVAGDTGPLHLAAALGVPTVALFGPTAARRNGPYGEGHRALQSPDGTMAGIAVPAVLGAVLEILEAGRPLALASWRVEGR